MKAAAVCILALGLLAWPAFGQDGAQASTSSLAQRAETGEAQSQFELGRAYEDGKGVAQDDALAAQWFRKAAEQGNAQAQNSLGVMYALGRGVERNKEEAVGWYRKAAKQGLPEAIYNVAISYYNGEGVGGDINRAYTWMMVAARKGDAQAAEALKNIGDQMNHRVDRSKFDLAELYEKGEEVPQDLPAAVDLYLEAARKDHRESAFASPAQYKLCQLYIAGKGVPQDYAQAKPWCKKSGVGFAYVVMARMAERGLGQEKDRREAMEFYRKAAIVDVPDGYMDTARLLLESAAHEDNKNAYFWYLIATRRKFPGAEAKLAEAAARLDEKEIAAQQKAFAAWLKLPRWQQQENLKQH